MRRGWLDGKSQSSQGESLLFVTRTYARIHFNCTQALLVDVRSLAQNYSALIQTHVLSESGWTIAARPVISYEVEAEYGRLLSHMISMTILLLQTDARTPLLEPLRASITR